MPKLLAEYVEIAPRFRRSVNVEADLLESGTVDIKSNGDISAAKRDADRNGCVAEREVADIVAVAESNVEVER